MVTMTNWTDDRSTALLTDHYELTGLDAALLSGVAHHRATFELFSRGLPDGRRLGWAEWGPADGEPVLFFGGAAMGRSIGFGADALEGLGVRLISVERPGLGASDPQPGRTLGDWPRADARVTLADLQWVGLGRGHGHLQARQATVEVRRGTAPAGTRRLWFPDLDQQIRPAIDRGEQPARHLRSVG